jgi:SAM-dependent methyltransferase
MECILCKSPVTEVLSLDSQYAVSSLGKPLKAKAKIYLCPQCSHCQTIPSINLFEYYSTEYKTLSTSFDEDDLYGYDAGKPIYRNAHMAKVMIEKFRNIYPLNDTSGPILDFGCGKSLAMKNLMAMSGKKDIYLYDVSEDYTKFWDSFVPRSQYVCFELPAVWNGFFSLVTSFFSMEHVPEPVEELEKIRKLLKPNGYAYIIVPNMYSANISDMLVVDHIQHYSETSMRLLLARCGFEMIEADHYSHSQGSIYIAKPLQSSADTIGDPVELSASMEYCKRIAHFWKSVVQTIKAFEDHMDNDGVTKYYIIGAGILGTYISTQLKYPAKLAGFIDSNTFKQTKGWLNKKVFAPGIISWDKSIAVFAGFNREQIKTVLPGLLPAGIKDVNSWTLNNVSVDV